MQAEIIAVGSELLTPDRIDTNSLFLTQRLNHLGIAVARKTIVGDQHEHVRDAFRCALDRCDLVVSSGGLGPTLDDLTREAVAELLSRKLVLNSSVLQNIEARFRRLGRTMPEVNKRQAMVPEGADLLENPRGTAPGLWLESAGRIVVLLPGPPHELKAMFTEKVEPRLERLAGATRLFYREIRTAPGEIQIHLRAWSSDHAAAERVLDEMVERITFALGENVFTSNGQTLEEIVARELALNQATVATAESCTGGLLAERLTRVPGSSSYFLGGVVCYSNDLKTAWTDVPAELIESKGAVSPEVAQALAQGIRRRIGATLGIGITGIAGPSGGSPEKPVGLVYIALADANGSRDRALRFPGDRERIRWHASQAALDMLRRYFIYARHGKPSWPTVVQS